MNNKASPAKIAAFADLYEQADQETRIIVLENIAKGDPARERAICMMMMGNHPAGRADVTIAESLLLAAWRESDGEALRQLVNMRLTPGGLTLAWSDPLFDESDE